MFKLLSPTFLAAPFAWLTIFVLAGVNAAAPFLASLGVTPGLSWTVMIVQLVIATIFVTPLWRLIWRLIPKLNDWFYPDLNGEWDVVGNSNWSRIELLLDAANRRAPGIDMRHVPESQLPPLHQTLMRAKISQSWLRMNILLWNPTGQGPIKESKTLLIEPFRGADGRHGLGYIFEQENVTAVVSDDRTFKGAGWVVRDREDPNVLCGQMWSDRVWRRGMNTAAEIRFTRR